MKPQKHFWNRHTRDLWCMLPPSRRLRKLYRELDAKDHEIEAARNRRYVPCHAPSDYQVRRRVLAALTEERDVIVKRIDLLQNE